MSFSSGVFSINSAGQPAVAGEVITSAAFNALTADLANGLSTCLLKDGTQTVGANIPMAGFKFTGLGGATATTLTDSLNNSFTQTGTGAVARAMIGKVQEIVSVKDFGATGDGTTDDTTDIQDALDATDGVAPLYFPPGTYLTQKLTINSNQFLIGAGVGLTTLKLKNTTNDYLIYGAGSDALWGTNTDAGITNWGLRDMTLDGNLANNATGLDGIAVYGQKPIIENVYIKNCKRYGMRTEWYQYGEAVFGMEGLFRHIVIDTVGQHGWLNNGPHDSHIEDVIIIDPSQTTTNTYDGFYVDTYGAGHFYNVHCWVRASPTAVPRYAINLTGAGSELIGCIADTGATGNIYIGPSSTYNLISELRCTGARGGKNLIVRGNNNRISGYLAPKNSGTAVVGITLGTTGGDSVIGNIIDMVCAEQLGGVIDWTYTGGSNKVTVRGVQASGTSYIGSPGANDESDIRITGAAEFRLCTKPRFAGITAAGTVQADATALAQGYSLYQISVVAAGTGVRLWTTVQGSEDIMVFNAGANTLNLFPASGDQINLAGTDNAVTLASGTGLVLRSLNTTQWYAVGP